MSALGWSVPVAALLGAPVAGVAVALLARRRMRFGAPAPTWIAAAARGAAVALAVAAAAGPFLTSSSAPDGAVLVASVAEGTGADRTIVWPEQAPDARTALEALRAAAPSDAPAALGLVVGAAAESLPAPASAAALRPGAGIEPFVLSRAAASPRPEPAPDERPRPGLVIPLEASSDVPFPVVLDGGGEPFGGGTAVVTAGEVVVPVVLAEGARRAATEPVSLPAGRHVVTALFPDGRAAAAVVSVAGPPSVLVVTADGREPRLAARLRHQGLPVTTAPEVGADLAGTFDVCILGPGTGRRAAAWHAERVVAGGGLLVLGGDGARGLSRLRDTALARVLPVELPEPPPPAPEPPAAKPPPPSPERPRPEIDEGEKEALRIALLLCVDRSGSMSGTKLSMAQQAAVAAARTLSPEDRVGVIAFDDDAEWVVPFQSAGELQGLYRRVAALRPGGGTNFHPALRIGYRAISEERCPIRHVILLTDGVTRPAVFRELVEAGTAQGITLSTVAIGDGADTQLLALLAGWGRGRLYPATDPERLPQVVTVDTRRFAVAPREEKERRLAEDVAVPPEGTAGAPTEPGPEPPGPPSPDPVAAPRVPRVVRAAAFLRGLERETWPALRHAEPIRPRGPATAPLLFDGLGAAFVVGRSGEGRVALVAADVATDAAVELWAWPESGRAFAQLVRSLAPDPVHDDDAPEVRHVSFDDGTAALVVRRAGGGTLRLSSPEAPTPTEWTCAARGDASVTDLAALPAAAVFTGTFAGTRGGDPVPVAALPSRPRTEDAGHRAARISVAAGAPLRTDLPPRPRGAPVERREPFELPFLVTAAALLVVEAAARRGSVG